MAKVYGLDLEISVMSNLRKFCAFEFMADLEHCQTSIVRSSSTNQLLDCSKITSLRAKTKKRGTPRHDMKFDSLSDHDKVTLLLQLSVYHK